MPDILLAVPYASFAISRLNAASPNTGPGTMNASGETRQHRPHDEAKPPFTLVQWKLALFDRWGRRAVKV